MSPTACEASRNDQHSVIREKPELHLITINRRKAHASMPTWSPALPGYRDGTTIVCARHCRPRRRQAFWPGDLQNSGAASRWFLPTNVDVCCCGCRRTPTKPAIARSACVCMARHGLLCMTDLRWQPITCIRSARSELACSDAGDGLLRRSRRGPGQRMVADRVNRDARQHCRGLLNYVVPSAELAPRSTG